jgi:hypothetical protein
MEYHARLTVHSKDSTGRVGDRNGDRFEKLSNGMEEYPEECMCVFQLQKINLIQFKFTEFVFMVFVSKYFQNTGVEPNNLK